MSQTNTFIRLRQTDILQELIEFLQATKFRGLDKTEIIRASLAEIVWQVKQKSTLSQQDIDGIITARKELSSGKVKSMTSSKDIQDFVKNSKKH